MRGGREGRRVEGCEGGGWEGGKGNMRDMFERNTVPRYFPLPRLNNPSLNLRSFRR